MVRQLGFWVMPVSSAARLLGVSKSRVYQLLEAGELSGEMMDSTRLVGSESVDALIARRERRAKRAGKGRTGI